MKTYLIKTHLRTTYTARAMQVHAMNLVLINALKNLK